MKNCLESSLKLSLCMIVKNERGNLPRCLASVKPYVNEMIIVDTGSQDGTSEIALNYKAKVRYFEWCDDFSAARNYAISQASGDWILMLDADETLEADSEEFVDIIRNHPEIKAYYLSYIEVNDQHDITPSYRLSLFRNNAGFKYLGRFHEELHYEHSDPQRSQIGYINSARILHYGFSKEQIRQKNLSRNIPMLERIRQEEGLNLRLLYCLAQSYADTQQREKAQECYAEAYERLLPHLVNGNQPEPFIFVPALLYVLGVESLSQKDYETVILICQRGLEWCPNFPPLNYLAGATIRTLGFPLGAAAYFENCIRLGRENSYYKGEPVELTYMTTYPAYDLGCVYIALERWSEALAAFEMVLSFDANFVQAQQQIDKIRELLADPL